MKIADKASTGNTLPASIKVRAIEDDGPTSADDGVCNLTVTAPFSTSAIVVRCEREENDGLATLSIISVRIRQV